MKDQGLEIDHDLVSGVKKQKVEKDKFFITNQRSLVQQKTSDNTLWQDHERAYLEDVTMNLIADDEVMKNTKGKTVMKWDKTKKRYTLQKVDREGKVIHERKNEAGKKITKNDKHEDIYKKWQQRTHMSLQRTGEKEDHKLMQ